jgi:hypothetical protein
MEPQHRPLHGRTLHDAEARRYEDEELNLALAVLEEIGLAYYDDEAEHVYIPCMAEVEHPNGVKVTDTNGNLTNGFKAIEKHVAAFKRSKFYGPFRKKHRQRFGLHVDLDAGEGVGTLGDGAATLWRRLAGENAGSSALSTAEQRIIALADGRDPGATPGDATRSVGGSAGGNRPVEDPVAPPVAPANPSESLASGEAPSEPPSTPKIKEQRAKEQRAKGEREREKGEEEEPTPLSPKTVSFLRALEAELDRELVVPSDPSDRQWIDSEITRVLKSVSKYELVRACVEFTAREEQERPDPETGVFSEPKKISSFAHYVKAMDRVLNGR